MPRPTFGVDVACRECGGTGRARGSGPAFAEWLFLLLGARRGDELDDLYPGSGIVARSWAWYTGVDPARAAGRDPSRPELWAPG